MALATGLAVAVLMGIAADRAFHGSFTIGFVSAELGLFLGAALYLWVRGRRLGDAFRTGPVPARIYPLALMLGVALLLANVAANSLLGPESSDRELVASAETVLERVVLAIGVVLVAPVVEESLFRGLLQGAMERRVQTWIAIALAALPFGLLHGPALALFFFLWSLPVGWVTWRLGSIRPAIVVHAVNNLVGVVGLLAIGPAEIETPEAGGWSVAVVVVALAVAGLWTVRLCRRIDRSALG
jgi:membrane protease YdiL (CAAX protease family)